MNPTFEQVIEVIRQLPPPEREKVKNCSNTKATGKPINQMILKKSKNVFDARCNGFRKTVWNLTVNGLHSTAKRC